MHLLALALRRALVCAPLCLAATSTTVLAALGEPASDALVIEAPVQYYSEAHSPAVGLTGGGRTHTVWLRENLWGGPKHLVRSYQKPPVAPGLMVDDPLVYDVGGAPLVATGRYAYPYSTVVYPDTAGVLRVLQYNNDGALLGSEMPLDDRYSGQFNHPDLATDYYGFHSAVVWTSPEPGGYGVYAQTILPWGGGSLAVRLNQEPSIEEPRPRVTFTPPDHFAVTWASVDPLTPETRSIRLQAMNTWGDLVGSEQQLWQSPMADTGHPDISSTGWGDVLVAYQSSGWIRAHRFNSALIPMGHGDIAQVPMHPEFNEPRVVRVAGDSREGLAVVWQDLGWEWPYHASLDAVWVDAFLTNTAPVMRLHQSDAFSTNFAFGDVVSDGDGDLWLTWTEGNALEFSRSAMARVIKGQSHVDLAIDADQPNPPVPPGEIEHLAIRVHNYAPSNGMEGFESATGLTLKISGLDGAQFDMSGYDDSFDCTQTADELDCRYHGEIEPNSVIPLWLPLQMPLSGEVLTLLMSVTAYQDDLAPQNNQLLMRLGPPDVDPAPISFETVANVEPGSEQLSNPALITGVDGYPTVTISNGEYSVDGGPFTSGQGWAYEGANIRVRHTAAPSFDTATVTLLTVGSQQAPFTSVTRPADLIPDAFSFASHSEAEVGSEQISGAALMEGFDLPLPISVSNGEYRINGGAWTSIDSDMEPDSFVELRHYASSEFSATVSTTLTVAGVSADFVSQTVAMDADPDPLFFGTASSVATGVEQISPELTLTGFNVPLVISVADGSYSLNGGAFTTVSGQAVAGDRIRLRHTSASAAGMPVTTVLALGSAYGDFTSITGAHDTTPNAFNFTNVTGARRNRLIYSNPLTLNGYNMPVPVSIVGGMYSIGGGAWTSVPGTINPGQSLRLRVSSSSYSYTTVSASVTVGGVSDVWSVTTGR
jgi:hypothetical protein